MPKDENGDYFYIIIEGAGVWDDAPNRGNAQFATPEWREDWQFVYAETLKANAEGVLPWIPCEYSLSPSDEKVMQDLLGALYGIN